MCYSRLALEHGPAMPILQAILLCDQVRKRPDGKLQLQGLFDTIKVAKLPSLHPELWVFLRLLLEEEDGPRNQRQLSLFLHRPSGESRALPPLQARVSSNRVVQANLQLKGLQIKEPGHHWLELFCDREKVGACRFLVVAQDSKTKSTVSEGYTARIQ